MAKKSPEEIKQVIYDYLFKQNRFTPDKYLESENDFMLLCHYFHAIELYYADQFEGKGTIKIQKWAVKAVAEGLSKYSDERIYKHNFDITLEEAFGIPQENKLEKINELYATNKRIIFRWINRIRMHYGLNIKDSVTATFKIIEWYQTHQPRSIYNFNASQKSIQDAYYRAYPQHEFIKWVTEEAARPWNLQYWIDWLEVRVPEAGAYCKRKMKLKKS